MATTQRSKLPRGDRLPRLVTPTPGPRSRALSDRLAKAEAPGINTLYRGEPSILWQEARGANVLDVDGNLYIDLTAGFGVAAIGHRHPRVLEAARRQGARLLHGLGDVAAHEPRLMLAERLKGMVPVDDARIYFAISGADAVEIAIKTALLATRRRVVTAFDPGYHGLTLGALAVTSRPEFRRPFADHLHPNLRRVPFGEDPEPALDEEVACVVVEPIVGREGVLLPPPGWLPRLADLCRTRGIVLIVDEIFTGFGRTGKAFAVDHETVSPDETVSRDKTVRPDLLCCGKALGGGLPIAAVAGRAELMEAWRTPGEALHTATFVAHPPACAASLATLDVLRDEKLIERAAKLGSVVGERLASWPERFEKVAAVRGRGLLWGVEMHSAEDAARLVEKARSRGILLLAGGPDGKVAQIAPPLVITERQLEVTLDLLEDV